MGSIESGKAKYARKTGPGSSAAAKYNAAKGSMPARWAEGLARAGVTPGPITSSNYQSGIGGAEYRGGDPEKWARNFREGISK